MNLKKTNLYRQISIVIALSSCSGLTPGLKQKIEDEAKLLKPAVEDELKIREVAKMVVDDSFNPSRASLSKDSKLDDYIVIALNNSPSIRRKIRELQVLGYKVDQVSSLEDPMFNLIPPTGEMTQTAAGMMNAGLGVSQQIPFPGKLSKKAKVAEQEVLMAIAELADSRIQLTAAVARAYYDFYLANISIQITNESQELLRQIREVAYARYQTGAATQQDVLRAEVELYVLMNDSLNLEQQKVSAQAKLNTLMNREVDAELPVPGSFALEEIELKLPRLLERAVKSNPKLLALKEQIKRDLEAMKLAHLAYYPDFRLGFGYSIIGSGLSPVANGDDNWNLPIGLNLPIWWQRIKAGVNASNAKTLSSIDQYQETKNLIFFGIQDSLSKTDTQYRQAKLFKNLILPRSRQAVDVSTANYRAGDIEFTALVENWRNWLKLSLAFHKTMAGLEQSFADLRQLVGVDFSKVEQVPSDSKNNKVSESKNKNLRPVGGLK